ncbi:restriction endonuclease [Streptomyces sp. NPDC127063]|uniref:restriction endonuclease n=1 Tax=Streptomyces sp. NPDC127063 TaxID=3347123 RepID=UPI003653942A
MYFGLLALVVCALGFAVRTLIASAQRRPVWQAVLCLLAASAVLALGRRRRRRSAARAAQRAAAALEAATDTALEELQPPDTAPPAVQPPARTVPRQAASPEATVPLTPETTVPLSPEPDGQPGTPVAPGAPTGSVPEDTLDDEDALVGQDVLAAYDALDADEFEQAVAALCERDGCTGVEVVGGAGDLGADVLAVTPDGRRMVIQCKHYGVEHRVGSQDLQRFGGTCYTVHEADVAVLVTTSDFTAPATEYADQCGIVCVNRWDLQAWTEGSGPAPWSAMGDAGATAPLNT